MLKNYLATALGSLLKNRLFTLINVLGLAIGLAACLLITLYVQNETSYDEHWERADRIYRVTTTLDRTGSNPVRMSSNSMALMPALKEYFSEEIEAGFQAITWRERQFYIGERLVDQRVIQVEPDFLEIFELETVAGSLAAALENPGGLALSEATARTLFGRTDVTGETVSMVEASERVDYRILAVYREPVGNTVLELPALQGLEPGSIFAGWLGPFSSTDYVLLAPGVEPARIEGRIAAFTDRYADIAALEAGPEVRASERMSFQLQGIRDVYLRSPFEGASAARGDTTTVLAFSAIAVLVLLIGCINFTVLGTAKATQRAREVAMRKTVGAYRSQLITQFLGESFLVVLAAMVGAVALMELLLPVFEAMIGKELKVSYADPVTWLSLLLMLLAVGLLGGLYPAFVLSHFRPAAIFKTQSPVEGRGSLSLRNLLVLFQFGVSIALIIATSVIYAQVRYAVERDPGFDRENLLVVERLESREGVVANRNTLKRQVEALPGVVQASLSGHQPMQRFGGSTYRFPFTVEGEGSSHPMPLLFIDHDFFPTYEIPLLAGRLFDEERDPSSVFMEFREVPEQERENRVIINANAARTLGFADPEDAVGERLSARSFADQVHGFTVIGVVADSQFYTLRDEARAEAYIVAPDMAEVLTVRYQGEARDILSQVSSIWRELMGDALLETSFVDQNMEREFAREGVESRLLISFSLLAILIACLGLYGSAAFTVDRRTKEIGIRKVMGAQVREIVSLLLWQFSKPVLLANLIAWPAAVWAMLSWLQRFPYRLDALALIPLCVLAGAIALSIAWLTVAGNTVRVARRNPVYALRYE